MEGVDGWLNGWMDGGGGSRAVCVVPFSIQKGQAQSRLRCFISEHLFIVIARLGSDELNPPFNRFVSITLSSKTAGWIVRGETPRVWPQVD